MKRLITAFFLVALAPAPLLAQTTAYSEGFENGTAAATVGLANYSNSPHTPYTASVWWLNYPQCNGVVVRYTTPAFATGHCDGFTANSNNSARNNVRRLADVLGQVAAGVVGGTTDTSPVNGSTATTRTNHALTAWTIQGAGASGQTTQFETSTLPLDTSIGRYYTARVDVAEASCTYAGGVNTSSLNFLFVSGTTATAINSSPIRACTNTSAGFYTSPDAGPPDMPRLGQTPEPWGNGGASVRAGRFISNGAIKIAAGATQPRLRMTNSILTGDGNDFAIDNITLVEVTPAFSKSFSPSTVVAGGTTVLTFTITNTSDNLAKSGWEFTDNLTAGLTLANTTVGGTCRNFADTGTPANLVGAAGASSFTIRGSLPASAACTVTVNIQVGAGVTSPTLQNCGSNISSPSFIVPPGAATCAVLNVGRQVSLTKQWANAVAGNAVSLGISATNAVSVTAGTSAAPSTTTPASTVVPIGGTATVSEAFTSGSATSYTQAFVCRKTSDNSVLTTTPSGLTATFTMPNDSAVTCTVTNTGMARLTVRKSVPSGQGTNFDFTQSGITGSPASFILTPSTAGPSSTLFADQVYTGVASGTNITVNELATNNTSAYSVTDLSCANQGSGSTGSNLGTATINNGATTGQNKASITVNLTAGADVLCTFTNTRNASIVITKNTIGGDGTFTFAETANSLGLLPVGVAPAPPHTLLTSGGTAAINTQITGITLLGANVAITENPPPAGFFLQSIACTNLATGAALTTSTSPSATINLAARQVQLGAVTTGNQLNCTFTNGMFPRVTIRKQSNSGTGSFSFASGTNGLPSSLTLDTTAVNPQSSSVFTLAAVNTNTSITETIPTGWALSSIVCADPANNAIAVTANTTTGQLTIPAAAVVAGANYTCTFTNTRRTATVALAKTWVGAVVGDTANLTATDAPTAITLASVAGSANETDTGTAVPVNTGTVLTLSETLGGANIGLYNASTWSCTGTTGLSGNTLTIGNNDTVIVCTIVNTRRQADLRITKTNTPGVNGNVDQTGDTATSGASSTYTLTVTNAGPDAVTGAVVSDTPVTGLTCPATNPVTCAGPAGACPAGALTVADLTAGITLGTLAASVPNNQVALSLTCQVN